MLFFGFVCRQPPEKKKTYTTTTERKSFGELFWPQRRTFQAGGSYKNPIKNQENHINHRIFPLWPPFFGQRKVPHWSRAVYHHNVLHFSQNPLPPAPFRKSLVIRVSEPHPQYTLRVRVKGPESSQRDLKERGPLRNLQNPAFCEILLFPAVFCVPDAVNSKKSKTQQKSANICEKTANLAPSVPFSLSLLISPDTSKPRSAPRLPPPRAVVESFIFGRGICRVSNRKHPNELAILKTIGFDTFRLPENHPNGYPNCWCTKIAGFDCSQNMRF